ncbi:MAG: 5-aminopentanamidase [Candidatus Methanomethylophilaceae archaeon]|nr:5-aminopentanamidase [Candidatus Methanomethylophilaceae archaeon]
MELNLKVCQYRPVPADPERNSERIAKELDSEHPDVLIFPEMFLTGYGKDCSSMNEQTEIAVKRIKKACRDTGKAAVFGGPCYEGGKVYNSLYFVTPDDTRIYRKIHLARFGIYSESDFASGDSPVIGEFRGVKFGLCICYDIFFPEVLRSCALAGSVVNICISASAWQSKPFLETILPARALENVSYTVFANNTGKMAGTLMFGRSRILSPFGDLICSVDEDEGSCEAVFSDVALSQFRNIRHHISDARKDVAWNDNESLERY